MANKNSSDINLKDLVENFVNQLVSAVEAHATQRVHQTMLAALGSASLAPRRRGRPPKNPPALFSTPLVRAGAVRRRPKQFCPVPNCNNVAAPVFGMVCSKHKDVPKAQIKKYRAERRASKSK